MDKPKFETKDLTASNVKKITELFPAAISEGKINFDLLRTLLGDDVYGDEAYEFTWVGKRAAIAEAGRPIRKTLRPCLEESKNWDMTENLYIEGDNLDVLKLLQESYLGKVKMIYIDPPYNTGNDFVYRDNFTVSREDYEDESGIYDEDGDRLFKNTETNGRFHSDWCSMMYPRMILARNMLRDDGVIFISIDDNEVSNLRKICDEVFGENNFIGMILWKKKTNGNNMGIIPPVHDYIIAYAKSIDSLSDIGYEITQEFLDKTYSNPDNDERGAWTTMDLSANHKGPYFKIKNPATGQEFLPPEGRYWVFNEDEVNRRIADGRIIFGKSGTTRPVQKVFALERSKGKIRAESWWHNHGMNEDATIEIKDLFGQSKLFTHPKPTKLIYHLVKISTSEDDIIIDFFSGSATTADAVMQMNAEDSGKRKFIMVQLPEVCDEKSEAFKAGYINICEIGKERIRRAGEKIKKSILEFGCEYQMLAKEGKPYTMAALKNNDKSTNSKGISYQKIITGLETDLHVNPSNKNELNKKMADSLDIGFRVLKLDDTNMKDVYYAATEYTQDLLELMESNIKDDRTDMDLLFGCLLDWGLPLSMPHTHEAVDGATVHTYNNGDLIACFADNLSDTVVKTIAKRKPLRAVFRDASFTSSPEKINVTEIFKLLAPNTNVRVI